MSKHELIAFEDGMERGKHAAQAILAEVEFDNEDQAFSAITLAELSTRPPIPAEADRYPQLYEDGITMGIEKQVEKQLGGS